VPPLSRQDLAPACRIFLKYAYPDGVATIPAPKMPYYEIPTDHPIEEYLPPAKNAIGVCQDLSKTRGGVPGYEFRLGSATFPYLKLRIQTMDFHQREVWVYSVDTHDHFHQASQHLSAEDAAAWRKIIEQNRTLKQQIEEALAAAGFLTPKNLLKLDLTSPTVA
jgi:hypothetical protein